MHPHRVGTQSATIAQTTQQCRTSTCTHFACSRPACDDPAPQQPHAAQRLLLATHQPYALVSYLPMTSTMLSMSICLCDGLLQSQHHEPECQEVQYKHHASVTVCRHGMLELSISSVKMHFLWAKKTYNVTSSDAQANICSAISHAGVVPFCEVLCCQTGHTATLTGTWQSKTTAD